MSDAANVLLEKGMLHVQELGEAVERARRRHAEATEL